MCYVGLVAAPIVLNRFLNTLSSDVKETLLMLSVPTWISGGAGMINSYKTKNRVAQALRLAAPLCETANPNSTAF